MKLHSILRGIHPISSRADSGCEISDLVEDSRHSKPGALFFAVAGSRTDGNRHVTQAIDKGAVAVMSELKAPPPPIALTRRDDPEKSIAWIQVENIAESMAVAACNFFSDPSAGLTVIGVTGTNGKTTISYFLESIIKRVGGVAGVVGTINHRIDGNILEKAINTTPDSLELTRLLARMRDQGATGVAIEVSSHALALRRVEEIHFDVAILTNVQSDHLDFHKTRENYIAAKERIFDLLNKASSPKKRRVAVLNGDDEACRGILRRLRAFGQGPRIATFGLCETCDYRAENILLSMKGASFRLHRGNEQWPARMKLLGEHNVHNALAAAAAAWELGMDPRSILEGIAQLEAVPGRLETVSEGQDFMVVVDFAHTEAALSAALHALSNIKSARIITVFGCGGDRDKSKRGPMGKIACELSDEVILTSDNPRNEDPLGILREIEEGARRAGKENYRMIPDRKEAIVAAIRTARRADMVLIAGKGHEDSQILRGKTIAFDDRAVAAQALRQLRQER